MVALTTIAITSPVASDNIVNAAEAAAGFTIDGTTTNVGDGQAVTVVLNGITYSPTVTGGAWSVTVPNTDALPDSPYTITADVAGATQATQDITVDETGPGVSSILRIDPNPTNAGTVQYTVTFSEAVTGVDAADFALTTSGLSGASITSVIGAGATFTVTVNAGTGDGTLRLDFVDDDTVVDTAFNPAGGAGSGNADFSSGEVYTIDRTPPTISIDTIASDDIVNAAEAGAGFAISGTTTDVEDGQVVTVFLNGHTYSPTVTGNAWTVTVPSADALADDSYAITADVSDLAGNPATQAKHTISVDESAPPISIDQIASDDIVNAAEAGAGFAISGTTRNVEDGQVVTVVLNGITYSPTVTGNAWSVTVPSTDALPDGPYTITADVSDFAGNPASQATHAISVDESAPTISIDTIASDDIVNAAEAGAGFAISGTTTDVEDGQVVTVVLNGVTYSPTVTGNAWSVTVPSADALADDSYAITADVSDLAGNPATQAKHTISVDESAPTISIDTIASDDIVNAAEAGAGFAISGTTTDVEDGQVVTVVLNGITYSPTVTGNAWTVTVPSTDALADGPYTITADVSDAAGNPATEATHAISVDETAPSISNLIDHNLVEATSTIVGTATATATITKDSDASYDSDQLAVDGWTDLGSGRFSLDSTYGTATLDTAADTLTFALDNTAADSLYTTDHPTADFTIPVKDTAGNITTTIASFVIDGSNDAPVNTVPGAQTVNEDTDLAITGLSVSDVDLGGTNMTVTLTVQHGIIHVREDVSGGLDSFDITNNDSASVTLSCDIGFVNATLAATNGVVYRGDLHFVGSDQLTMHSDDSGTPDQTTDSTVDITVNQANHVPVFTNLGEGAHPIFSEGSGSSVALDTNVTVSDLELNTAGNYGGATLTLARIGGANPDDGFAGTGSLDLADVDGNGDNVSLDGGATFVGASVNPGDGTFSVTFNSNATAADVAAVMQNIVYSNSNENPPSSVQIGFTFSDGNGQPGGQAQGPGPAPGIGTGSVTVDITPVNDPPVLFGVATDAVYAPGTAASLPLAPGLAADDIDSPTLAGATVTITAGSFAGDQFAVSLLTNGGGHFVTESGNTNISVASNIGGVLTLQGTDTLSNYQLVLRAVVYSSSSPDPTNVGANPTRTIAWQLNDGGSANNLSAESTTTLHFDFAPVIDLDQSAAGKNFSTAFTEGGAPVAIADTDVAITDSDTTNMDSATIVLVNAQAGDTLTLGTLPSEILGSVDTSVAGQITVLLGGEASPAVYQSALQQVFFSNTSDNPSTLARDITVTINDGEVNSNTVHTNVTVFTVNDAPVNTLPAAQVVNEDTALAIAGLAVSDADAGSGVLTTTLTVAHGTLTVASAGGAAVTGGPGSVTLTGTLAQINTTLSAAGNVTYQGFANYNGGDTLTVVTNDGGSTGSGGPLSDTDILAITVNAVNDAPVNTVPGAQSVNEDTNLAIAGLAVGDVDAAAGTLTTTLSVAHGTLTVASAGGAGITGSGTGSVTLTGTLAQINTTLSAAGNVVYRGLQDYNGGDVLNVVTNDGGNTGTGGAKSDTDTVAITVNAVNDAPVFAHFGATHTSATEQTFTLLNSAATVSDVELDAANGSAGNYAGASLIIGRAGSPNPNPEDTFGFGGAGMTFTVDTVNHVLLAGGQQFATYSIPSSGSLAGTISVNFNSLNTTATTALVNNVLEHISYKDTSDTPPASVTMHYTFNDGNAGAQGLGGNGSDTANRVVDITPVNDAPVVSGSVTLASIPEGSGAHLITQAQLLGNASDVDGPSLTAINLAIATGAGTLVDNHNGTWSYTPAANDDTSVSFDYQVTDGIAAPVADSANLDITQPGWTASTDLGLHPAGWSPFAIGDFVQDGTSDILWYNSTTLNIDVWKIQNGQWAGSVGTGSHPAGYQLATTGDFNGDGTSDALWYNPTTGDADLWKLSNGQWAGSVDVGTHPLGYQPVASGDFNHDGVGDVLWYNSTSGDVDVWEMSNSGQWAGSAGAGPHPLGWQLTGVGDFTGDGTSDVIWFNPTTGKVDLWKMANGVWADSLDVGTHPAGSTPVGIGDFNGDGTSDLLWFNPTTNDAEVWLVSNGHWSGSVDLGTHPAGWTPAGIGDFNHDGISDILWRETSTGHTETWLFANH